MLAMQYSPMHIVRSHAHCTVLYVQVKRATGYAEKTHYWEEFGGAEEDFVFYEESLWGRNWVHAEEGFPLLWWIINGKELGAEEVFALKEEPL
jgi:hypothetical protein